MTANSSASSSTGASHYRWLVCALLFFATTINYVDRQILSLVKEILDKQLGWTNEDFGRVNGAFQGAYGIGLLSFGWFIDRYGTKIGYAVSIAAWSLAALGHGLVNTLSGFFLARISLGFGEGGNFPSAIKATALWFPKRERAFATSLFNSGANMGAIIAPMIVPFVAFRFGWHWAFAGAGIAGLIWLLFWIPLYGLPEKKEAVNADELALIHSDADEAQFSENTEIPGQRHSVPLLKILSHRQTWSFIIAKLMTDPIWWFFLIWLPDYFKASRGLEIKKSFLHLSTIYILITILSIIGGWITGHLTHRGWTVTRARKTCMFIFACCVVPILAVSYVGDWTAVLLIALAGSAHQAWSANLYTTVSDMFPKGAVASIIGIGGFAGAFSGIYFPIYCGQLLDRFHANPANGYAILFSICAFAYLVAFAINHLLAPKFEPVAI